jgi:chorismate lyase / 3-hydroxybenzoate synthase
VSLTLDNIRLMERTMSLPAGVERSWKVFVRNSADIPEVRAQFSAAYPADAGSVMFLHADICRSSLLVEIEAVFSLGA